jgi:hypothetical protein
MKRFWLHALFWCCFYIEFAYFGFLWDRATFPKWTLGHVLATSLPASLLLMIPQVIFPYYMIYYGIDNLVKKKADPFHQHL